MVIVTEGFVEVLAPCQRTNRQPLAGFAVAVTWVPASYVPPGGKRETVPWPCTEVPST